MDLPFAFVYVDFSTFELQENIFRRCLRLYSYFDVCPERVSFGFGVVRKLISRCRGLVWFSLRFLFGKRHFVCLVVTSSPTTCGLGDGVFLTRKSHSLIRFK